MFHERLIPSLAVRHVEVNGRRVILDLRTGSYKVLNEVASVLWSVLLGEADAGNAFEALTARYGVQSDGLSVDFAAFRERCVADGLLERSEQKSTPVACPRDTARFRPGIFQALKCLLATHSSLKKSGFSATYQRYARLPVGRDAERLKPALQAFVRAENLFVSKRAHEDCLVRSLSLFRFLRCADAPAEHVIGVRSMPFCAHAWVESNGTPVLDDGTAHSFVSLARIENV